MNKIMSRLSMRACFKQADTDYMYGNISECGNTDSVPQCLPLLMYI